MKEAQDSPMLSSALSTKTKSINQIAWIYLQALEIAPLMNKN